MMNKRNYFLFYLLFIGLGVNAQSDEFFTQNRELISLNEELSTQDLLHYLEGRSYTDEFSNRQSLLLQAKCYLKLKNNIKASKLSNEVIEGIGDPQDSVSIYQMARAYELKGHVQHKLKQVDSAYYFIDYSSIYYLINNDYSAAVYNYNMMSTIFYLIDDNTDALKAAFKALDVYEENYHTIDSSYYVDLMVDIGNIYMHVEDYDKSIETYIELFKRPKQLSDNQHGDAHNNMGFAYLKKKNKELAKTQFELAESQYEKTNNLNSLSKVYNNLALLYDQEFDDYNKSSAFYRKSISIKKELGSSSSLATTYMNLAVLFFENGQIDSAIVNTTNAESIFAGLDDKEGLSEVYDMLAKINSHLGNSEKAYSFLRKHSQLDHEINSVKEKKATETIINERNVLLQSKEIELLEKEKELTNLKLARSRLFLIFTASSLVFMLILFYMFMRFFKHKQKVDKQINKRNIRLTSVTSLVQGQEEERNRIARDLHDGVGNSLTLLNHKAMASSLPEIQKLTNQISQEVRDISHNIMPGILLKLGLKEALLDLAESWESTDVIIDIRYNLLNNIFDDIDAQLTLFRAIQETIKNAIEKGQSHYVSILFTEVNNEIKITIEDNGKGFDIKASNKGLGLNNIQNRIDFLKGELDVISTPEGSTVIITLPKL